MIKEFELLILLLLSLICTCSRVEYIRVIEEQTKETPNCPVSLDENTSANSMLIRTDGKILCSYNIESTYKMFMEYNQVHPINRRALDNCEKARIETYYYFFINPISIGELQVLEIFKKVLRGDREDSNIQILRRFLNFDLTDKFFSGIDDMKVDETNASLRQQYVYLGEKRLVRKEVGTWLMRPSSLSDSKDLNIEARSITYVTTIPNSQKFFINNVRIAHAVGYGYLILRRDYINNEGQRVLMHDFSNFDLFSSKHVFSRHGSLIDLLIESTRIFTFDLPKFYTLSRDIYIITQKNE